MRFARQVYYCCLSGMLGGLLAWLVIGELDASRWPNLWLSSALQGGGLGAMLVAALGLTRGVVERRPFLRVWFDVRGGVWIGMIGGACGLLIGQFVFLMARGGWSGRVAGWLSLSVLIGLAQAIGQASQRRLLVGCVAGLISGAGCGLAYEALTQLFLAQSDTAQLWASCMGFMLVGGLFATGIPTMEHLASTAVLVVRSGARIGSEFVLLDRVLIGSGEECRVMLTGDPGIEPKHVLVECENGAIRVTNQGRSSIAVEGQPLNAGCSRDCTRGDHLRIGQTEVAIV